MSHGTDFIFGAPHFSDLHNIQSRKTKDAFCQKQPERIPVIRNNKNGIRPYFKDSISTRTA